MDISVMPGDRLSMTVTGTVLTIGNKPALRLDESGWVVLIPEGAKIEKLPK